MASSLGSELSGISSQQQDANLLDVPSENALTVTRATTRPRLRARRWIVVGAALVGLVFVWASSWSEEASNGSGDPSWSVVGKTCVAGLGGGMVLGLALTMLMGIRDRRYRRGDDICADLDLPALAHIPLIERAVTRSVLSVGNTRMAPALVAFHHPEDMFAQRFHCLSARLQSILQDVDGKTLQIISVHRGEGTTTTLANLALSLAQSGSRVLVVDADFRSAALHAHFGLDSCDGFLEVLNAEAELKDAIHKCPELPSLHVLPAGRRRSAPQDLPRASFLSVMLKEVRDDFDFVLVDCPPVLEAEDSVAIAKACDATVMVISPTRNSYETSDAAANVFRSHQVNLVGVVLNNLSQRYMQDASTTEGWEFYPASDVAKATESVTKVKQAVN